MGSCSRTGSQSQSLSRSPYFAVLPKFTPGFGKSASWEDISAVEYSPMQLRLYEEVNNGG